MLHHFKGTNLNLNLIVFCVQFGNTEMFNQPAFLLANGNAVQTLPKLTNNNLEPEQIMKRQSSIRPSTPPAGQPLVDNQIG